MRAPITGRTGQSDKDPARTRGALSPDVSHFLVQLSIGVHKVGTYPADHPELEAAIQALTLRLDKLLAARHSVQIGVGRERLLIEGGTTDPSNAVLRSLAEALHRHQIASIRFEYGVSPAEVSSFLHALSRDPRRMTPLGAREADAITQWPQIRLTPMSVDQLQLADHAREESAAEKLWLALAQAALETDDEVEAGDRSPIDLAEAVRRHAREESYDRVIADYLVRVGQELVREGGSASNVAHQLGDLITQVGNDTLRLLLRLGSDLSSREQLVRDLSHALPARSVVALARAAADESRVGISNPLFRLFAKMAANAESATGPVSTAADSTLRDAIRQLVDDWTLEDPNPHLYREVLRELSTSQRTADAVPTDAWIDAIRLIDIALETDAVGPVVWRAIDTLIQLGRLDDLLETIGRAADRNAVHQIRTYLGEPDQIAILLRSGQSRHAVDQLLRWTGPDSADVLLDGLEATDSRATRRRIIERLVTMGGEIVDRIVDRLDKGPWFVQRNMLYLLSEIEDLPAGFNPGPWLGHSDARVRKEAVRLALRVPETRAAAIAVGIAEADTRTLNLVLSTALDDCPPDLARPLIALLDHPETDAGIRLSAVRLLGRTTEPEARTWLLHRVIVRAGWWRRPALAPKSQEVLIALTALRKWRVHRDVAPVLELARHHDDVEIRFAVTAAGPDWP